MSDPIAPDATLPMLQVKSLGKLYSRRPKDMRKRMSKVARNAFFNIGKPEIRELYSGEFWAVKNVSFDLQRGEAIGVIGLNGSGKTSLLRILAGQILPDAGEVIIRGSSAAMIDLQAGFQQNAPGRENIFLRAAALGFRRKETELRVDEIIAFSELGDAIDAPLASYSSGMRMRLAFAIMATVAPDVLLIDEVLAVGDFRFRQKCLAKMREMRARSAFVFVSHSMNDVSTFCDRVIVLHKGRVYFEGPPAEAIEVYESLDQGIPTKDVPQQLAKAMGPVFENPDALAGVAHFWCDEKGNEVEEVKFSDPLRLRLKFRSLIDVRALSIGIPVWSINRHYVTGLSTQVTSDTFDIEAGDDVDIMLEVAPGFLNPGVVKSMLTVLDGPEFLYRQPNPDLVIRSAKHPTWGSITVPHRFIRRDKGPAQSKGAPVVIPLNP
ncbi:MAG: ABC transporter ATP-binding protein [Alphaproteobacteria bacterium]|nr:ABC transporter ATP-binding protein [Alphaproteobacteria bacterium]MBU2082832.1 ABC transporter ATP-binding protein [Alphaproteobacteria bacterium]MBU2142984.1 ABC transporter ATP-binding protein [Alphaproteobacteria bacterium]MBU2196578.1 ABC transporter ATP-binding protein [Alphaproteobacteria bacterium]